MEGILDWVRYSIGLPPVGLEWLEYTIAGVVSLYLLQFLFDFFRNISKAFWR